MTEKAFEQMMSGLKQAKDEYGRTVFPDCRSKYYAVRDAIELLKKQEAKKVLQIRNVAHRTIGYCPSCGRGLDSYKDGNSGDHITNYCYNCGQAVKWNDSDNDN